MTDDPLSLHRALTIGAARYLHSAGVGHYAEAGPVPADAEWPIYLYEWGNPSRQIVVNFPIITADRMTFDTSFQVLVRAETDAIAEPRASKAADALAGVDYPDFGGPAVSAIHFTSLARLGRDQNGRPMWALKLRLYGRNK